jgi:hypothetical protein
MVRFRFDLARFDLLAALLLWTTLSTGPVAADLMADAIVIPIPEHASAPDMSAAVCPVLAPYGAADQPLARVAAATQPGGELDILAVGSATVLGPDALHPDESFPYLMAEALKAAWPQTNIRLTLRGGKGLTAQDMLEMIHAESSGKKFQLVLWQTGTVEAVKGISAEAFHAALADGAEAVHAAGADLVLVDPQFSRFLEANTTLKPYRNAFRMVAALPGVALFHRFDLTRAWANSGGIDLERTPPPDRQKTLGMLRACRA